MIRRMLTFARRRFVFEPDVSARLLLETGDTLLAETGNKLQVG